MNGELQYVMDTDICIYLLNGHQKIKEQVAQVGITSLAVTIITIGELYFGAYNLTKPSANKR